MFGSEIPPHSSQPEPSYESNKQGNKDDPNGIKNRFNHSLTVRQTS